MLDKISMGSDKVGIFGSIVGAVIVYFSFIAVFSIGNGVAYKIGGVIGIVIGIYLIINGLILLFFNLVARKLNQATGGIVDTTPNNETEAVEEDGNEDDSDTTAEDAGVNAEE